MEVQQILQAQGYLNPEPLDPPDDGVNVTLVALKSSTSTGEDVAVTAIDARTASNTGAVLVDVAQYSSISHPHFVQFKSVFRKDNWLCIVQAVTNGGDLFSLARRFGNGGLPEQTARYLIQQLALTFVFAHSFGIILQHLSPSKLLISWTAPIKTPGHRMPILKVNLLNSSQLLLSSTAQGAGKVTRVASMYSSVHWVREDIALCDKATQVAAAEVCDLWSVAVTLYFLLYGSWPFSKAQISRWPQTAAEEWSDDAAVSYQREGREPPSEDVVTFLKTVFASGRRSLADVRQESPSLTLTAATQTAWFHTDLPAGAAEMDATARAKTEQRRAAPEYAALRDTLMRLAGPDAAPNATL